METMLASNQDFWTNLSTQMLKQHVFVKKVCRNTTYVALFYQHGFTKKIDSLRKQEQ